MQSWLGGRATLRQPGERTRSGRPGLAGLGGPVSGLAIISEGGIARQLRWQPLMAKQVGWHMGVAGDGLSEGAAGFSGIACGAKEEQSFGPDQEGAAIVGMRFEQDFEFAIAAEVEQAGGEEITDAEIIVGAEPQQIVPVGDRLVIFAAVPERAGQASPPTHVRAGFDESPEMAAFFDEDSGAKRAHTGFDALAIQLQGFSGRSCGFGQKDIGIGTIGGQLEGFARQRGALAPIATYMSQTGHPARLPSFRVRGATRRKRRRN
jgi:hypothetical protein